jgi:hypothetical protein
MPESQLFVQICQSTIPRVICFWLKIRLLVPPGWIGLAS